MRPLITLLALTAGCAASDFEAFRLEYDQHPDQVVQVEAPYAVLIFWQGEGENPQFHFYDRSARLHLTTESWYFFLDELSKLPGGTVIQRFNTCCAPCDYAMPDEQREELEAVLKSGGRTWRIDPIEGRSLTLICTCESKGFRFPSP